MPPYLTLNFIPVLTHAAASQEARESRASWNNSHAAGLSDVLGTSLRIQALGEPVISASLPCPKGCHVLTGFNSVPRRGRRLRCHGRPENPAHGKGDWLQ